MRAESRLSVPGAPMRTAAFLTSVEALFPSQGHTLLLVQTTRRVKHSSQVCRIGMLACLGRCCPTGSSEAGSPDSAAAPHPRVTALSRAPRTGFAAYPPFRARVLPGTFPGAQERESATDRPRHTVFVSNAAAPGCFPQP